MPIRALTWNLFHGRDFPPNPRLLSFRSRLLRVTERDETHLQVNRDLLPEFAGLLAGASWDIALLQESPPRWAGELAHRCGAEGHCVLTSRNSLAPLRSVLARLNPDLIASNEGGSNLTLVRGAAGTIAERRELVLRPGPKPERRTMAFTRLTTGVCVANLHASTADPLAAEEIMRAAEQAIAWAAGAPVILGGDLNVRPRQSPVYAELSERLGFTPPADHEAIDHILVRGLEVSGPPRAWAPAERELEEEALAVRLSDHAPVEAVFN